MLSGLSAEALKSIITLCKVNGISGCASNKLRVEKLLQHFQYDEETIALILSRFPKKKTETTDNGEESQEDEHDVIDKMVSKDARCEAGMLAEILEKMQGSNMKRECDSDSVKTHPPKKQKTDDDKAKDAGETTASCSSVPFDQLVSAPDLSTEKVPPHCSFKVYQGAASPYVIGILPTGVKFRGCNSHSRSFDIGTEGKASGSSGSRAGRARLTESAARAQVLSWLWDWYNHEGSKSLGK